MLVIMSASPLRATEEGHLLIENCVNIFFVASLSVSLHNLLDFYIYIRLKIKPNRNLEDCTTIPISVLFVLHRHASTICYSLSSLVGTFPYTLYIYFFFKIWRRILDIFIGIVAQSSRLLYIYTSEN
jgi:hypothetical protein